jgi:hypothetical protein
MDLLRAGKRQRLVTKPAVRGIIGIVVRTHLLPAPPIPRWGP